MTKVFYELLRGTTCVFRVLPSRWILWGADLLGEVFYVFDRRGYSVGHQNLDVVFGDRRSRAEKDRILRASMRGAVRAVFVLLHAAPLTPARFRRWVEVSPEVEVEILEGARRAGGAVVVSAHIGSWEVLLGLANLFRGVMATKFLVEASVHPAIDRLLAHLRGSGGAESALRKGGALALGHHVRDGGAAGMLVDRNVRRALGGIWAPFFGLDARTTSLPALLARRNDVPIMPVFCIPKPDGRYCLLLEPESCMDVRSDDRRADAREITARVNRIIERVILDHPEAWNWTLKRWKSRATEDRGAYPPYSIWDP